MSQPFGSSFGSSFLMYGFAPGCRHALSNIVFDGLYKEKMETGDDADENMLEIAVNNEKAD